MQVGEIQISACQIGVGKVPRERTGLGQIQIAQIRPAKFDPGAGLESEQGILVSPVPQ